MNSCVHNADCAAAYLVRPRRTYVCLDKKTGQPSGCVPGDFVRGQPTGCVCVANPKNPKKFLRDLQNQEHAAFR